LALQALRRVQALDPSNPRLLEFVVSFLSPGHVSTLSEVDRAVVEDHRRALCPHDSLDVLITHSLQVNGPSARHILAAAKATAALRPDSPEAEELVFQLTGDGIEVDLQVSVRDVTTLGSPMLGKLTQVWGDESRRRPKRLHFSRRSSRPRQRNFAGVHPGGIR
jgi:hypothetical protein